MMLRLFVILTMASGLAGCVVASPYGYGYGYAPAPAYYGYAPAYYAAPSVSIGVGGYYGWHGH
jgi:hypothetical protein